MNLRQYYWHASGSRVSGNYVNRGRGQYQPTTFGGEAPNVGSSYGRGANRFEPRHHPDGVNYSAIDGYWSVLDEREP